MSSAFLKVLPHIEQCEEIFIFARNKIIYFYFFISHIFLSKCDFNECDSPH
jgi:hypothetical protein